MLECQSSHACLLNQADNQALRLHAGHKAGGSAHHKAAAAEGRQRVPGKSVR